MSANLHGKKILITREKKQAKEFSEIVRRHGGIPVEAPLLKISCVNNSEYQGLLQNLNKYQWIFFTSANGVHCFLEVLKENSVSIEQLKTCKIAVVGHKTEAALYKHGLTADFTPSTYNADVMAAEFIGKYYPITRPVLLVRGNRSRDVLPDEFIKNDIEFDSVEVYQTEYNESIIHSLHTLLQKNTIDFLTFTSPSTVEAFVQMGSDDMERVKRIPCVCIGTTTEEKANTLGFNNTLVPLQFTIEGMVKKISDYIATKGLLQ